MTDNIIVFPKAKVNNKPVTLEDIYKNVSALKETQVDDSMEYLQSQLFTMIAQLGFDLSLDDDQAHVMLVTESIKSFLLNSCGMPYYLQDVANELYPDASEEETEIVIENGIDIPCEKENNDII